VNLDDEMACDAIVICFPAPHSFSGDDTVEFSMPGNMSLVDKLMSRLCSTGARPAEPGEFTYRAYLNGKIDLAQAEAINESICASNETALRLTLSDRLGSFSAQVQTWIAQLTSILARIEAVHEYPGDFGESAPANIAPELEDLAAELTGLLDFYAARQQFCKAIKVVILGPPNVGKSTLFNALLGFERAITAPEPGTTRDYLEEPLSIDRMTLALVDTAGLRPARDLVEMMGVERSGKLLAEADALILMEEVFHFQPEKPEPAPRLTELRKRAGEMRIPCFPVINKLDTVSDQAEAAAIKASASQIGGIAVSLRKNEGLESVQAFLKSLVDTHDTGIRYLLTARQASLVQNAVDSLAQAREACLASLALDAAAINLYEAQRALARILSAENREAVIEEVFRSFCLGK
jgi:tRNA modification GTPase